MTLPTRSATDIPGSTYAGNTLGEQMARAIAARDGVHLRGLFTTPVVFRGVTPRRFFDAETAFDAVDSVVLGTWFDPARQITGIAEIECGSVGAVERVRYRFEALLDSGPASVEQVAYYTVADGRISAMRVVCSGYEPR